MCISKIDDDILINLDVKIFHKAKSIRAWILKHLVEAEKPTFQRKLSFQKSKCTAGLTVATIFGLDCENYFL